MVHRLLVTGAAIRDIPTSGVMKVILGDNPRRVGLILENIGGVDIVLSDKADTISGGLPRDHGFVLTASLDANGGQNPKARIQFDNANSCPRNAIYAGASGVAVLQVLEVTDEDSG